MIEIPDLDELTRYSPNLDLHIQHDGNRQNDNHEHTKAYTTGEESATDLPKNYTDLGRSNETINHDPIFNEVHDPQLYKYVDKDQNELSHHLSQISIGDVSSVVVGNERNLINRDLDASSPKEPTDSLYNHTTGFMIAPTSIQNSQYNLLNLDSNLTSSVSLQISEGSYGVQPQYVEYNTAQAYPVHQVQGGTNGFSPSMLKIVDTLDENQNVNQSVNPNNPAPFLQSAPIIQSKKVLNYEKVPNYENSSFQEAGDDLGNLNEIKTPSNSSQGYSFNKNGLSYKSSNLSNYQVLASPASQFHVHDHAQPSPQLPPPGSSTSMQKLALSNGEEFGSIRRGLATDLKTPAEYTLHIIFTQFVRHAERKLNLCLDYPLTEEPLIIELLAEGVDPQFDKIVSSLGYVARRKPKPVIDSVMFWRKSKSEVASMAASEVERTIATTKANLLKVSANNNINPANPGIAKNANSNDRSKRSLSLMRTKSFKMAHRRNQSASSTLGSTRSTASSGSEAQNLIESEFVRQKNYYDDQIAQARQTAIQADRKSLASIYILCRVLIEVVKQTSIEVMGEDLEDKLEEIVYTQLKTTDPISTSQSLVRSANWDLFAELLGFMSQKSFLSVTDRFIADLEKVPSHVKLEDEPKLHLLIQGMQYLKLTNYPLEVFEESADFLQSLAKFFEKSQNETIIYAYCEVLSLLLLPLANILTAETNHPTWVEAVEKLFYKAYLIWSQTVKSSSGGGSSGANSANTPSTKAYSTTGYISNISYGNSGWAHSFRLMTSALAVSRKELFSDIWYKLIEDNSFKLKPKVEIEDKTTYIICTARLVWVYIYRLPVTLNNTIKQLDSLFQLLFLDNINRKKNQWMTSDPLLTNALVKLIRIVGFNHLNYVLDNVLIKILKLSFNGVSLENSSPERLILIIKSYLSILEDFELARKPEFPSDDVLTQGTEVDNDSFKKKNKPKGKSEVSKNTMILNEFLNLAKSSTNAFSHEEICRNFATLLKLLDNQYGSDVWLLEGSSSPSSVAPSKSQSAFSGFHFGIDFSYPNTKNLQIDLFSTLIDAIPWTMVPLQGEKTSTSGISVKNIIEILTRNSVHENLKVANSSFKALKRLASRKNPSSLITIFARIAFQFNDKPGPKYNSNYLNSNEFNRLLKIYVELLNCWLKQFTDITETKLSVKNVNPLAQDDELMNKDVLNDLYQINHKNDDLANDFVKLKPSDELEWKTIITVIEEVEGNGLFFLCSQDSKTRHHGISILKLVEQFDQAIYNITDSGAEKLSPISSDKSKSHSRSSSKFAADIGTRLIHVLEDVDFLDLIKPFKKGLSLPERSRVSKLKNKKNILVKLAESEYGIDCTIWFRLYPKLLDIFFEKCPMPVAMCRSIVCVRLVQMHELVLDFSDSYKNYTSSIFSRVSAGVPPEVLVNQWKLYLIFACCSLTSTNEQKISFPTQPTHGRKRSMQMFIQHQKITSAKSVFRMVLPLLKSQQPMIRDAIISGLSCSNINIFKTFLENVPQSLNEWEGSLKKRDAAEDRMRCEVVHILSNLTDRYKSNHLVYADDWMVANLVSIVKNVKSFLSLPSTQTDIEFQRLRRYFCGYLENVFIGLQDKSELNKWLPFEARIGCFNFLKEWCGFGDADITEDRYNAILKNVSAQKDQAAAAAILEVERKLLQYSSLSCMAVLCSGPINLQIEVPGKLAVMSFDIPSLMGWIRALFCSDNDKAHEIGKVALRNILNLNLTNDEIYQEVIKECYASQESLKTTESYFIIFVDVFLKTKPQGLLLVDVICLANFLVGHDNYEVRLASMKLLKYLDDSSNTSSVDMFAGSVCSKTRVVYKKALFGISAHLASLRPDGAFIRISYMTKYFNLVGNNSRRDILSCLLPWVQIVSLNYEDGLVEEERNKQVHYVGKKLDSPSLMVLNNLFEITVKFGSSISNEVEALWVALGSNSNNFDMIVDFIMLNCLERNNPTFLEYSRQIIDYLAFSQTDPLSVIDKFINNLQPRSMVPPQPRKLSTCFENSEEFPYIANLWKIIPYNEKDAAFSIGQLSMVFLVDLFTVKNDRMIEKLPLLLHVAFSLLDHYLQIVQEQAGTLLIHLIHALAPNEPKSTETIETLMQRDYFKYLWVYDDLNNDKKGARTPKNMDLLARNVLEIFTGIVPNLQDDWSRVSLNWATTCAVRHIACRSFQIFRSLLSFLDQGMLKDMLHRLSNTISDETQDIQGFAMQILMTLNAITAELESAKLIDFPELFWSSVACLSTIHEQEFIEVLSTMSKFVSKIDLDAPDTVSCLISTFPPKWEGKFEGLQQIVMVGLRSATAWEPSMKFLDKMNVLKDSEIIGLGESRLLMSVLANMPRFLHSLDKKTISPEIGETAMALSELANKCDKPGLARILVSLSKNRFRSKKDFLVQTITTIKNIFFPEYEAQALVLLLGFLSNKTPWVKLETMSLLKHIFPLVDLQRDEFVGVGADLISPLLRLLLTDFAEPALEVLDEAVIISGSQLDKDVLRMSLGNTSMKKEYEKTATLFGIPDESGWAIPMPAVTAASTRNNVHAVFSTCSVAAIVDENDDMSAKNEEIQFHMEDYYAPEIDHGDTVSVGVEEPDGSLSNVWAALDDFDSFFTKDADHNGPVSDALIASRRGLNNHHTHSASVDTRNSNSSDPSAPMDSAPHVYDKKASVILNRSLARSQSNTSFKSSLADSMTSTVGDHGRSPTVKRSYIPFRTSKSNLKKPNDSFTTPVMPATPSFDSNTSFRSPSGSTPGGYNVASSPSTLENNNPENPTRFEHLLGGNRKRSRKSIKGSPNASTASISPDLHAYWNNKSNPPTPSSIGTPPASAPSTASSSKLKEKKKFR